MNIKIKELLSSLTIGGDEQGFSPTVHDTFSALYRIASRDKTALEGEPLGNIVALLTSIESTPGGPYYSEFPEVSGNLLKHECDKKTNKIIERFLSIYEVKLPNLSAFLHTTKAHKEIKSKETSVSVEHTYTPSERAMMREIRKLLKARLASLDAECRKRATDVVERTIRGNPDKQMSLMPYYMKLALGKKSKKAASIPRKVVAEMCLANIFFWTAFIIYDDFWDEDEAADPHLLPIANLFARSYVSYFDSLFSRESGFKEFFHILMDKLDGANAWETSFCRAKVAGDIFEIPNSLPKYGDYAKKYYPPSGHIVGPLALLVLSGYSLQSNEAKYLAEYFKHYLIAMQMNDDMHDWEEDLERGHISTALDILLRDFGKDRKFINLKTDIEELRKVFWFTSLPKIAKKALYHTKKSRVALLSMKSIHDRAPLLCFINDNEKIAGKALSEQRQSLQFLKAYGKSYAG